MGKKDEYCCPHAEFIKALATELDVTLSVARHIYTVFYITILKQMKIYDTVSVTPFLKISRKMTKEKRMYDVNTGEYVTTIPREKFYCRIATRYQDVEHFDKYLVDYEEKLRQQEIYEMQLEQERKLIEEERERRKEELARGRRNKRRRNKYRQRKHEQRIKAIEKLLEYESLMEKHEKEKYRRELQQRKKGYK